MRRAPSLKEIKRIPMLVFVLIFVYLLINLCLCYSTVNREVAISSSLKYGAGKTVSKIKVEGNDFITGMDGRVNWPIVTFKEALLINLINTKSLMSFYDLFYLLIINLALYFTINRMNEDTIFSDETIKGFEITLYLIVLYPVFGFFTNLLSRELLENLTNDRLTLKLNSFAYPRVLISIFFIRLIPLIIKKGKSLQQEQSLTI